MESWISHTVVFTCTFLTVLHGLYSILSPTELMDFLVEISSPHSVRNGDTSDGILMKVHLSQKSIIELVSCNLPPLFSIVVCFHCEYH